MERDEEAKERAARDFRSLSTGTKCGGGGGRGGEGEGERRWASATAREREALIEFGFVWIIVKRLKRPETNLFASGRESFLVEDNK